MGGQATIGEASNNAALGACLANSTVASRCCTAGHAHLTLPLPVVVLSLAGAVFSG